MSKEKEPTPAEILEKNGLAFKDPNNPELGCIPLEVEITPVSEDEEYWKGLPDGD